MDYDLNFDFEQSVLDQLRVAVYRYAQSHPKEIDFEDVKNRIVSPDETTTADNSKQQQLQITDWMLKRILKFAKKPGNVDCGVEMFAEIFKYRHEFQVRQKTLQNCCPVEFFQILPFVIEGTDLDGNRLFIIRIKYYQKLAQFDVLIKHCLVYLIEQQDRLLEQGQFKGLTLLVDCTDFAYRNLNLEMVNFIISIAFKFPGLIRKVMIYELAWAFTFVFKMLEKLVNAKIGGEYNFMITANKANLDQYIAPEGRPEFLNNGHLKVKKVVPEEAKPFLEVVKGDMYRHLIDPKNALKINEYMLSLL